MEPRLTSLSTFSMTMPLCTIGNGYGREHTGLTSSFNSKSTCLVFHVPRVPPDSSSDILRRDRSLSLYSGSRCWNCLVKTLFRFDFSYFESNIIRIRRVEPTMLSNSKHYSMYELINDPYGLIILSVKGLDL